MTTTYTYKVVKGHEIKADVSRAADGGPRPVLVWIHGGALIMGSRVGAPPEYFVERALDAGFVIVSIDYRLAPETKLPDIVEDMQDAIRWVREDGPELFGGDPGRVCVAGESAGGYLTLLAGCVAEPKPKALVSFYGYGDIIGDWYSKPAPHYASMPAVSKEEAYGAVNHGILSNSAGQRERGQFYLYCRQNGLWPEQVTGWKLAAEREKFLAYCPDQNVSSGYPPAMLLHGDADTDVPHSRSERMADALGRAGVEHEFVSIEGAGHGFIRNDTRKTELDRAVEFLVGHVNK